MNSDLDDDLLKAFARARRSDHENAPAWRPECLERPVPKRSPAWRWVPAALATACVGVLAAVLMETPVKQTTLSEALPPLLDSPPGELFATLEPSSLLAFEAPSDFLLPNRTPIDPP